MTGLLGLRSVHQAWSAPVLKAAQRHQPAVDGEHGRGCAGRQVPHGCLARYGHPWRGDGARRIRRWREVGTPEVGCFSVMAAAAGGHHAIWHASVLFGPLGTISGA
jgi:hypothetical protein